MSRSLNNQGSASHNSHVRSKCTFTVLLLSGALIAATSCGRLINRGSDTQSSPVVEKQSQDNSHAAAQKPCALPAPNSFVSDFANVLDEESKQQLERKLEGLKKQGNIDFVVVTVNTTGNEPASTYSLDLARCWEVGAANSDKAGILLLIAIEDRKWHMQVSQSINEVLPDNEVLRLGNLMPESFRVRQYSEGVHRCVDATIAVLAERRGFSPT